MMSLWDALRMNMMISYQELVRTFHSNILIGLIRCFYERLMLLTIFAARLICINLEFDIVFPVIKSFEFWS
ncbi:hypothetical protein B8021_10060 [Klebsiella pneumoniae]|nr:hypothetical protein B8009_10240 [Klebsiella pneumoniae]OVI23717.1 hypothetical protein B8021_10060 [Klebsiella pneumoniae]OVI96952.1 hypothetical protein B8033_06340 [Klebsiella pneumoniae]